MAYILEKQQGSDGVCLLLSRNLVEKKLLKYYEEINFPYACIFGGNFCR